MQFNQQTDLFLQLVRQNKAARHFVSTLLLSDDTNSRVIEKLKAFFTTDGVFVTTGNAVSSIYFGMLLRHAVDQIEWELAIIHLTECDNG